MYHLLILCIGILLAMIENLILIAEVHSTFFFFFKPLETCLLKMNQGFVISSQGKMSSKSFFDSFGLSDKFVWCLCFIFTLVFLFVCFSLKVSAVIFILKDL